MEVMVPMPPATKDLGFDSAATSPYASAPSSPRVSGDYVYHYTSAPSSPSRIAAIYSHFNETHNHRRRHPKSGDEEDGMFEFEFNFSGQLEQGLDLADADELFEAGKIRPLKPPPQPSPSGRERGRERSPPSPSIASRSRKMTRSLSPLRGGGGGGVQGGAFRKDRAASPASPAPSSSTTTHSSSIVAFFRSAGSKKWKLKDLLLFRSASEGRVTGRGSKDPLRKYTQLAAGGKKAVSGEESKSSSFRSIDSGGSSRRGAAVSAHELHYTANRAASEELRRKTPLAYRQGLFGCLRFNPAVNGLARGFSSYSFNRS